MDDKAKSIVKVVVIVGCLIAAVVITAKYTNFGGNPYEGERPLKCTSCSYSYVLDAEQYKELVNEKQAETISFQLPPIDCPECGEQAVVRATKCKKCGSIFALEEAGGKFEDECPECGYSEAAERFKKKK